MNWHSVVFSDSHFSPEVWLLSQWRCTCSPCVCRSSYKFSGFLHPDFQRHASRSSISRCEYVQTGVWILTSSHRDPNKCFLIKWMKLLITGSFGWYRTSASHQTSGRLLVPDSDSGWRRVQVQVQVMRYIDIYIKTKLIVENLESW